MKRNLLKELFSKNILASKESREEFEVLRRQMINSLKPETKSKRIKAELLVINSWRLIRLLKAEAELFENEDGHAFTVKAYFPKPDILTKLHKQINELEKIIIKDIENF